MRKRGRGKGHTVQGSDSDSGRGVCHSTGGRQGEFVATKKCVGVKKKKKKKKKKKSGPKTRKPYKAQGNNRKRRVYETISGGTLDGKPELRNP